MRELPAPDSRAEKRLGAEMSFPRFTTRYQTEDQAYTGVELRPHFLLERFRIQGSALCAFVGACRVETAELVDWEDRLALDRIEAKSMIHFIGEFFGMSLREGVLLQRLVMAIMRDELQASAPAEVITRDGDDLFTRERKLSVSIVTASPVSILLHVGINVDPAGAPVPAIGLAELGVAYAPWIERVLRRVSQEWDSMDWACVKVRPVM